MDTVTISKEDYEEMLNEIVWLRCLDEAGVDNWEGYSYASDLYREASKDNGE